MPTTSCFPLLLLVLLHRLAAEPHASSLRTLCSSGGAEFVQLGACTSSFVKCGKSGKARLLRCFEGQVFANGKCRSPSKVAACQDERLLFMVEETRQLAELDGVCQQTGREAIDLLHFDCADQALLCDAQEGQPVVVSCPPGLFYSLTSGACERRCAKREDEDRAEPAAIRAWLLSRSCSRLKQRNGRKADDDHRLMRVHSERCRAFLVDCGSDLPTVFHCEADELFDERSKTCRPIDPEKDATCTPPRICSGHAFDFISHPPTPLSPSSSLSCSPSFVYCDALEPRTFECRDGFVFHQGKCVSAEKEAPHCVPCMVGARRTDDSSNATCASFEECVPSEKPPGARWKQQQCKERHAYFDVEQTCVRDAGCAKALDCSAGSHVRLSCGEALVCDEDGRLRPVSCTPPSRFDATSWRCDFSRPCQDEQAQSADSDDKTIRQVPNNDDDEDDELAPIEEGEKCDASRHLRAHPTNCRRFFECSPNSDRWTTRKCRALRDGGDFFDATQQRCVQDEHVCQSRTSSLQTCQSGERVVVPGHTNCARYLECRRGSWRMMRCGEGEIYDAARRLCVLGDRCEPREKSGPARREPIPPRAPTVLLIDQARLKDGERPSFIGESASFACSSFAPSTSPLSWSDPVDCSRFWRCSSSSPGRREQLRCPAGSGYDAQSGGCVAGFCQPPLPAAPIQVGSSPAPPPSPLEQHHPDCREGARIPRDDCGTFSECRGGRWISARCSGGRRFSIADGKCSSSAVAAAAAESCTKRDPSEDVWRDCSDGTIRPLDPRHHEDACASYAACERGRWMARRCPEGTGYDVVKGRCSSGAQCWASAPTATHVVLASSTVAPILSYEGDAGILCYVGQTRPALVGDCSAYEVCDASSPTGWSRRACAYGSAFIRGRCQASSSCGGGGGGLAASPPAFSACKESWGVNGYRPNDQDCGAFYQCAQGRWVAISCPPGLFFNPRLAVCDWPHNVWECAQS